MSKQVRGGGVGFLGLLALLFIALQLMGYIAWSWLWVLAPLWVPFGIAMFIVAVVAMCGGLGMLNKLRIYHKRRNS